MEIDLPIISPVSSHPHEQETKYVEETIEDLNLCSLETVNYILTSLETEITGLQANHMASMLDLELFNRTFNSQIVELLTVLNPNFGKISYLRTNNMISITNLIFQIDKAGATLST